jgi:galactokinase/mevalonate kinase-like predicted kinase
MTLRAPLRFDFAGGFTDNVSFLYGVPGRISSITIEPYVTLHDGETGYGDYVNGSGLAISTAANLLEFIAARGGAEYLLGVDLTELAELVCVYENEKYSITVGKADVYPIVFGGFNSWECEGELMRRVPVRVSTATLAALEERIVLLYSGMPRESETSLEEFNENYRSGLPKYRQAVQTLKDCAIGFADSLATGDLRRCARYLRENWEAEKIGAPSVSSPYIDALYRAALQAGALGGKLSGAGGGGYFFFYSEDPDGLVRKLAVDFPEARRQPFRFVHQDVKSLNLPASGERLAESDDGAERDGARQTGARS